MRNAVDKASRVPLHVRRLLLVSSRTNGTASASTALPSFVARYACKLKLLVCDLLLWDITKGFENEGTSVHTIYILKYIFPVLASVSTSRHLTLGAREFDRKWLAVHQAE
jgi:hypothetical protein